MQVTNARQLRNTIAAALMLAACALPADAAKPTADVELTDEKVVAAMKKGIDFLLTQKKGNNWEVSTWKHGSGEIGGETALVLYALLHAGESLQDQPQYQAKLSWRGPELAPAVSWLQKNMPKDTYVAGFEASALTLLPKRADQKPGEGPQEALDACKFYLLLGMGQDGGYTYTTGIKGEDIITELHKVWEAYYKSKTADTKKSLDGFVKKYLNTTFGGAIMAMQMLVNELREKARANPAEAARAEAQIRELEKYAADLPQNATPEQQVAAAKKVYDELMTRARTGNLQYPDPKDKKKKITITKEELLSRIEKAKAALQQQVEEMRTRFSPIGDLSNTQYGALGAWALADYGIEFPNAYWQVTDRFWRMLQKENGAWPYWAEKDKNSDKFVRDDTMGVAGIATLFVCQEFLDDELRLLPKEDKAIERGLAWLDKSFKPNTGDQYYLYGVERVGLASGLKFFGTSNWYKEGAADLVKRQKADGSWGSTSVGFAGSATVPTAYSLLFLSRGRNPVVFNKLAYNGPWNARPRDDAYVTRWMSKRFEKPINWQIVNLQVPVEEWMDAPILLITGSQDPKFKPENIEKLRAFVNAGGMIFSTADGGSPAFSNAMKKYAEQLVNGKYEMRQLPRNHFLFSKEMGVDLPNPPQLMALGNGVRELWIHSPGDVGADWQMRKFSSRNFELGAALYFYASGMGSLRSKLQPLAVETGSAPAARTVDVARVDYAGNSDPEPGAWPRLAKLARANAHTQVNVTLVKPADLNAKKFPLAHITGSSHVAFNPEDVKALQAYLNDGGLLFIDAAGGNQEFAASARELLKQLYPNDNATPLPPDHPIFTGAMADGAKIADVDFRKYGNLLLKRRVTKPMMDQVVVNGRTRVLFSQWDICSGFLGTNTWGILGYAPSTAEALGRNILLFALNPAAPGEKAAAATP